MPEPATAAPREQPSEPSSELPSEQPSELSSEQPSKLSSGGLSESEVQALEAVIHRILPDEGPGPSAAQTTAAVVAKQALEHPHLAPYLPVVRWALAALQADSRRQYGQAFALAEPAAQDALLRELESSGHEMAGFFVSLVVQLALDGYLGDPAHGGNREGLAWSSIGFSHGPHGTCAEGGEA